MKEITALMEYADGDGDQPLALCICRKGNFPDWETNVPDEVLYVPESALDSIDAGFREELGAQYYQDFELTGPLLERLKKSLSESLAKSSSEKVQVCVEGMAEFIKKAESMSDSHFLIFAGP